MNLFNPHLHLREMVIVGAGGTGAQIARSVARMMYDMRRAQLDPPLLRLIDPDSVTEKNVGRQLFTAADVGQPKAVVLMRRFNLALGLDVSAVVEPFEAERHLTSRHHSSVLLIGAVDNERARQQLAAAEGVLWLDCGNFTNAGQVVLGNTGQRERVLQQLAANTPVYRYLPNAALLFPQLLEPEPPVVPSLLSCADLMAVGEQGLVVNDLIAAIASQYIWKLLYRQPIQSFASFIDGDSLAVRSPMICRDELLPYLTA
ncbi:MAG: PRTRC system ThiF family protein [Chloroflexi bacterium]|nr:PRTRC system ThiF family protein [Chloroflexota bacterium]